MDGSVDTQALRPIFVTSTDSTTDSGWKCVLYPFFSRRYFPGGCRWNICELIVGYENIAEDGDMISGFEIWPLYWHYDNGVREESYDAFFPVAGTLRNRLFHKRIDWFAFPLFLRLGQQNRTDTYLVGPIFRYRTGPNDDVWQGWAVWPFYGHFGVEGRYDNTFVLWPFYFNNHRTLPEMRGGGVMHNAGVLPFYAFQRAPGLDSKTWVWPFFGYTTESAPRKDYHEVRYFYPFVVWGRGEDRTVTRFAPVYTYQARPGYDKTWYLWPIFKQEDMRVDSLDIHKDTVLYFLYKNEVQTAPGQNFKARKTQFWPLFGYIDDGAYKKQFQLLNPFEPFFSGNEMIRQSWTPFFSLYRYEKSGDELRHSLLWDLVLYDREGTSSDFSIGPLFQKKRSDDASSWSVAKGLLRRECKDGASHWSALWGLLGRKQGK